MKIDDSYYPSYDSCFRNKESNNYDDFDKADDIIEEMKIEELEKKESDKNGIYEEN